MNSVSNTTSDIQESNDASIKTTCSVNSTSECRLGLAARRAAQLPKLRDINRRQRPDSAEMESASLSVSGFNFDFRYSDSDVILNELNELYSYSELDEMFVNARAFTDYVQKRSIYSWSKISSHLRQKLLYNLMEELELVDPNRRLSALQCLAYLLQGNFMECECDGDVERWVTYNAYLLYEYGFWPIFVSLFVHEYETVPRTAQASRVQNQLTMKDNHQIRLIINCLYSTLEILRRHETLGKCFKIDQHDDTERRRKLREEFLEELGHPIPVNGFGSGVGVSRSQGLEQHASFASLIFDAVSRFCTSSAPHFPIKKLMLLLWKTILTWLGNLDQLKRKKNSLRMKLGLTPADDTVLVACTMEPVQVPGPAFGTTGSTLADFISATSNAGDIFGYPKRERPLLAKRQLACMTVDDEEKKLGEGVDEGFEDVPEDPDNRKEADSSPETPKAPGTSNDPAPLLRNAEAPTTTKRSDSPRPELEPPTPVPPLVVHQTPNVLPWSLKVRPQEIGSFLERERAKFFKFQLQDDTSTLTGLPKPILDCVDTLKKHVYISLADKQIEQETLLNQYPFSHKEHYEREFEPVENLYRSILPHVAQYIIGLLKILLAGAPTSKPKTDSINLLTEILTTNSLNAFLAAEAGNTFSQDATLSNSISEEMAHMTLEINRHKEILVKAISALTLLLLKHFKANHVYQAEYLSQHLVFANCIPLILKFFDQNVLMYVQSENELKNLSFPTNVLVYAKRKSQGDECKVNNALEEILSLADGLIEHFTNGPKKRFLWRNMFTSVNLLRILNKLTKWKHARTMMLVVFKSAPVLKRSLRVKHILIQLYALKLLKMQAKYLGRQWRKTNMELMSAIYNKVRHRLNDNWAYGNETQAKPWDFQLEEANLREAVEKFNTRRYKDILKCGQSSAAISSTGGVLASSLTTPATGFLDGEDFEPLDSNVISVLGTKFELGERFKLNYKRWLETEVYKANVDWDLLLENELWSTNSTTTVERNGCEEMPMNIEIKARVSDVNDSLKKIQDLGASFVVEMKQKDTFFNCPNGRLKLRVKNSEPNGELIFYSRSDESGPKLSTYDISPIKDALSLEVVLNEYQTLECGEIIAYGIMDKLNIGQNQLISAAYIDLICESKDA